MSHSAALVVVSVVLSAAVAFAVTTLMRPAAAVPVEDTAAVAALKKELAELREQVRGTAMALAQSRPAASADRQQVATVSDEQIAASVARWFAERGGAKAMEAAGLKDAAAKFDVKATHALTRGVNPWENPAEWKKVHEAGRMDELLAYYEEIAKGSPTDTKVQMELANAYLAALQNDQTRWQLSMKADETFDKVLALDSNHWEARFSKAVSYSFWPDFLGKKGEAISHFEQLVEQQKTMPVDAGQAQTYLFLGNLLEQRGDKDRAQQVWQQGLQRHPDSRELRGRTGG